MDRAKVPQMEWSRRGSLRKRSCIAKDAMKRARGVLKAHFMDPNPTAINGSNQIGFGLLD